MSRAIDHILAVAARAPSLSWDVELDLSTISAREAAWLRWAVEVIQADGPLMQPVPDPDMRTMGPLEHDEDEG